MVFFFSSSFYITYCVRYYVNKTFLYFFFFSIVFFFFFYSLISNSKFPNITISCLSLNFISCLYQTSNQMIERNLLCIMKKEILTFRCFIFPYNSLTKATHQKIPHEFRVHESHENINKIESYS